MPYQCFTEYELDSDDFDDASLADIQREQRRPPGAPRRERTMPLLVGLMDASAARRTPDTIIPMYEADGMEGGEGLRNVDLDDLAEKQWSGGGLLNSVANMANSILGAGKLLVTYMSEVLTIYDRNYWYVRLQFQQQIWLTMSRW